MTRAIRKHAFDFAAIVAMAAIAIFVFVYIIVNQDARPTIPLFEERAIPIKAEFSDAQAVVPGQGQSVRVAGVEVGKIGSVEIENGLAVVTMNMHARFEGLVRENASALLRPRTGLKDMFVELDPGSKSEPAIPEGGRIAAQNTAPDIDPDEILAALDTDTRAYLQVLVNGLGKGLENRGDDLREVFARFEPLHRDVKRVNGALAARRQELARLIHNYGDLTTELARSDKDLERLVTASNTTFEAFASQDDNIAAAVARLPGALRQTQTTLAKANRLGQVLGPTLNDLRPAMRELDDANREVLPLAREGESIIRREIRPLVRTARPYVGRSVRPAARNLSAALPDLTTSFLELNRFFNMFAFNPANYEEGFEKRPRTGAEPLTDSFATSRNRAEGFLFWTHWVTAHTVSLFSTRDAQSNFRRVLAQANCESIRGDIESEQEALEHELPEPLKPLAEQFAIAMDTLIFGQNRLIPCSSPDP